MAPDRIKEIRRGLGMTQSMLAEALRLGANGARTVRRWEAGSMPISGPAQVALELMKEKSNLGLAEDD